MLRRLDGLNRNIDPFSYPVQKPSPADGGPQTKSSSESAVWKSTIIVVGVSLCVAVITIAVVIVCCDVCANRTKRRRKRLNRKGHTVAFDNIPKTQELDYEEVSKDIRIEVPGGLEVVRVYPSTGSADITPLNFLATSSPYLDEERERHSSRNKRTRTRVVTSEEDGRGGQEPSIAPLGLLPVDEHPVGSMRHSSKTGKHQRHPSNEEGRLRHARQSKSRDRKPPPPSSTFEEDLLMLARQNEVTEGGVALTLDRGRSPRGTGVSPVPGSKFKSSASRGPKPKRISSETIPLQSVEVKGRSRKSHTHHSSARPRVTTYGDEVRGHRVVVGQRPPVEGSYDTVPDSSYGTSGGLDAEHGKKAEGPTLKDESTLDLSTLKGGSTIKDVSGIAMTVTVDSSPRIIADSAKPSRKVDPTPKNSSPNTDPYGTGIKASDFRTAHGSGATRDRSDHGLHIQAFLRPDPGPDGQSQGGTFHSNSNSFTCSNSPSFRMSTERRPSTHSTFRPVPACTEHHHQSPKATPCPIANSSSPFRPRTAPASGPSSLPARSPSPAVSQGLNRPDHNLEDASIGETKGSNSGRKTDSQHNGTIPGPL